MSFKKLFPFFLFSFFSFFFFFVNSISFYSLSSFFSFSFNEKTYPFFLSTNSDGVSLIFLFMVSLITGLVLLYSELYMEHYKNKKFLILTLSFFFFMVILSVSGSLMNLLIGWDGLGVSSLMLIMFYPNKITLFNSYLTFFFNRLGDIFFVSFFCYYLEFYSLFFHLSLTNSFLFLLVFFFCLLTKSAQVPFSSWLPAAMSAPTPISAMVHSSTLVTAGLFIFLKGINLFFSEFVMFMLLLSSLTFILGGLLGVLEFDLKKIVAFSTMSQISMIIFFLSMGLNSLSLMHIFGHALFKTLLFVGCGILFLYKNGDQFLGNFSGNKFVLSVSSLMLVSAYSMSGASFSTSFFTKDLALENFLSTSNFLLFFILILGSLLTVLYSSKIFISISMFSLMKSSLNLKKNQFLFVLLFSVATLSFLKMFFNLCFYPQQCIIQNLEVFFINLLILSTFFLKLDFSFLSPLSIDILFLKNYFFGGLSKLKSKNNPLLSLSDSFFFKPAATIMSKASMKDLANGKFWLFPLMLLCLF